MLRAVRSLRIAASNHSIHSRSLSTTTSSLDDMKVLVANRGEIACRVLRTCQRLNIPTVAMYSSADGRDSLHTKMATEAYQVGEGPTPQESYLLRQDIVDIALQSGANYIHPGYGFLSEDVQFCTLLNEHESLNWIGPPASAMQSMASKSQAKTIMENANVPTTPGYMDPEGLPENQTREFLKERASEIGFPVLIKAVLGGGGKGMRLVQSPEDFPGALKACQAESLAAFGNSDVLLEKYLVHPRHIEVQVLADSHGNVRHLYERDCSLQRRHQKVIEEAPASDLPDEFRDNLQQSAVQAAQAVGYVNAGTVEFLLEKGRNSNEYNYYFCEMNTRLQVEHPVTELVTGTDLVEWQLRVAAGEELPSQEDLLENGNGGGHAFEARIYAENPVRGFVPSTGWVWHHQPPVTPNAGLSDDIRVDTALGPEQDVTVYYDPMVSKLIVHGPDRFKALNKLVQALKQYQVAGVDTNIDFLLACAEHEAFVKGGIDTGFLDRHGDELVATLETSTKTPKMGRAVGAYIMSLFLEGRLHKVPTAPSHPWSSQQGSWRMGGLSQRAERVFQMPPHVNALEGEENSITCLCNADGSLDVTIENESYHLQVEDANSNSDENQVVVIVDGVKKVPLTALVHQDKVNDDLFQVQMWPIQQAETSWSVVLFHPLYVAPTDAKTGDSMGGQSLVTAPMPGRITKVEAQVGDTVTRGDTMIVMEAMKMEHSIVAPSSGTMLKLDCAVDDVVDDGAVLMEIGLESDNDTDAA